MPTNPGSPLDLVLVPRTRDLGDGFTVRRALPARERRMVGPFVFFDQMGPALFHSGQGLDVRPHPHIGLATVTYVFEGEILHRDSLGSVQPIRPGEVNWMTAGRGIAHSERTPPGVRAGDSRLFGIQAWVALPRSHEEQAPAFDHFTAPELPALEDGGARVRLIAGALWGERSPVQCAWELFYADAILAPGAELALPPAYEERAAFVAQGAVEVRPAEGRFPAGQLLVFKPGETIRLAAPPTSGARVMLLGGAPMDGPRHIFWNFVSSSRERIEQAKADWRAGRFAPVPGETEFIPLPDDAPQVVPYP